MLYSPLRHVFPANPLNKNTLTRSWVGRSCDLGANHDLDAPFDSSRCADHNGGRGIS